MYILLSVDHNKMIEMDRLVMHLSGEESQTITTESKNSHATMKDHGVSLEKYVLNQIIIVMS